MTWTGGREYGEGGRGERRGRGREEVQKEGKGEGGVVRGEGGVGRGEGGVRKGGGTTVCQDAVR